MPYARRRNALEHLRSSAMGVIELTDDNTKVAAVYFRPHGGLRIISIIGIDGHGHRRSLFEIGVQRGTPWCGMRQSRVARSRPRDVFSFTPIVRNTLLILMRDLAWERMRHWKSNGVFSQQVTIQRPGRFPETHNRIWYNGIRICCDARDLAFIEFLQWHQVFHNRDLQGYIQYRANGIRLALKKLSGKSIYRRGKKKQVPRTAVERIVWFFRNSKTLCNPRVMVVLFRLLYPKAVTARELQRHPLMYFLMEEGIIDDQFFSMLSGWLSKIDMPELNIQVRYKRLRRNGHFVFQVYPTEAYWDFRKAYDTPYEDNPYEDNIVPF